MIEVRDLWKNYGETQALRGASFSIRPGETVVLLITPTPPPDPAPLTGPTPTPILALPK